MICYYLEIVLSINNILLNNEDFVKYISLKYGSLDEVFILLKQFVSTEHVDFFWLICIGIKMT